MINGPVLSVRPLEAPHGRTGRRLTPIVCAQMGGGEALTQPGTLPIISKALLNLLCFSLVIHPNFPHAKKKKRSI